MENNYMIASIGALSGLAEELERVHDGLEFQMKRVIAYAGGTTITYKDKEISGRKVNPTSFFPAIESLLGSLKVVYPLLFDAQHPNSDLEHLENCLDNYTRRRWHPRGGEWNTDVLMEMPHPMGALVSKIYIALKEVEAARDVCSSRKPTTREPTEALKASGKNTEPIKDSAEEVIKCIGNGDIWNNYRKNWNDLNMSLDRLGFKEDSEKSKIVMGSIDGRYHTSDKIDRLDIVVCREFMNDMIILAEGY